MRFFPTAFIIAALLCPIAAFGEGFETEERVAYYEAVSYFFTVSAEELKRVEARLQDSEEIPLAFFIAEESGRSVLDITEPRLVGRTWQEVMTKLKLGPGALFVPVKGEPSAPFKKAYEGYSGKPQGEWNSVKLRDMDYVNQANLKFITKHFGFPAEEVMKLRAEGKSFAHIALKARKESGKKAE